MLKKSKSVTFERKKIIPKPRAVENESPKLNSYIVHNLHSLGLNKYMSPPYLDKLFVFYKKSSLHNDDYLKKQEAFAKLKKQRSYRYFRLKRNLPTRGQRTHTNARTRRKRRVK